MSSSIHHKRFTEAGGFWFALIWTLFGRNFSAVPVSFYALLFEVLTSEISFVCFSILDCRL